MKSIETHWNGYRFRSRAEARWAVFFDAASIRFDYEPQGVVLDGKPYLPDFWIPDAESWMEVKGTAPTDDEMDLCIRLAKESGRRCLIAVGPPDRSNHVILVRPNGEKPNNRLIIADDRRNDGWFWLTGFEDDLETCFTFILKKEGSDHERWPLVHSASLRGYLAANSARFEHGESGPAKWEHGE